MRKNIISYIRKTCQQKNNKIFKNFLRLPSGRLKNTLSGRNRPFYITTIKSNGYGNPPENHDLAACVIAEYLVAL